MLSKILQEKFIRKITNLKKVWIKIEINYWNFSERSQNRAISYEQIKK